MPSPTPVRLILAAAGCLAVTWSVVALPIFWREHPLDEQASQILRGTPYTSGALAQLGPAIESVEASPECEPRSLQSAAVIRLRVMEEGFVPDQLAELDQRIDSVQGAIRRALACAPADPFLWLVLYSVESERNGFRSAYLDYIRQSYRLGPNEGWIAVRRVHVVFAIFASLPPDLADMAVEEFVRLVQNHLYDEPLRVLLGTGRSIRERLLEGLSRVGDRERRDFAARLRAEGVDLPIPGVEPAGQRPWR